MRPPEPPNSPETPRRLPADQSERNRVTIDALDETLFVEAGAGSGKTTQLVERVVNLVVDRGVELPTIAAITFTEAAASELRQRIRVRFEQLALDPTVDEARRAAAQRAVVDADSAAITTLHGFALRVLSEHSTMAGLPPRVAVLDEIASQLAAEERWVRFVDRLHADPANSDLLLRADALGIAFEPTYPGEPSLKQVGSMLTDSWDRVGPILDREAPPLAPVDFSAFDRAVDELRSAMSTCTDRSDALFLRIRDEVLPVADPLVALADPLTKLHHVRGVAASRNGQWGPGRSGKGSAWGGDAMSVRQMVVAIRSAAGGIVARCADDVLNRLLCLIGADVVGAARQRQSHGSLEFHDLLVLARELLAEHEPARQQLHRTYTRLLLDEFQDTDPIQIELAVAIASSVASPCWQEATPDPGRLFFVGDPKQSIYRFRRADIKLFLEAQAAFGSSGSLVRLSTNFRTTPDVVAWVNELFGVVMGEGITGSQPPYDALIAHRPASPGRQPVLLGGPHAEAKAADLRRSEASDVAAVIADIAAHPDRWPIGDHDASRPARLRDVTVLVPTRTSLPYLRQALDEAGLPYRLATGTLVYDTQEIRDLLAAVRAIDDPSDELSLVAALRSPLYACSDRHLLEWRAAGGRWELTSSVPDGFDADHPVAEALSHLRSLWSDRWWLGPSALLDRLMSERRTDLLAFAEARPGDSWRRLRFLLDQARQFEDQGGSGLRSFVEWAGLQAADGAKVHEPILPELDDDSVQIMTVHGSKGLEFPITIVSGLTTMPDAQRRGLTLLWGDDGLPSLSMSKSLVTADHDRRSDLEATMDDHEKLRLLYVACTRARDHLLVSAHHKAGGSTSGRSSFSQLIWDHMAASSASTLWNDRIASAESATEELSLGAGPRDVVDGEERSPSVPGVGDRIFGGGAFAVDRALIVDRFESLRRGARSPVVSATGLAEMVRGAGGPVVDDEPDPLDERRYRRGRVGAAMGTAVHAVLELLDLADPRGVDEQAATRAEIESVGDLADDVAALARSALASPAVRLAARLSHHKEVYVAAPVGQGVVIEGYVDLLIEGPDGLVVVDYKTDSVTPSTLDDRVRHYELQAAAYAVAIEEATGMVVVDCRFVFCRVGGALEASVADLPDAKARVRRAALEVAGPE